MRRVPIVCGGERHRLRVDGGEVLLEDHDERAEMSVVALGSDPCVCLQAKIMLEWLRSFIGEGTVLSLDVEEHYIYHDLGETFDGSRTWTLEREALVAVREIGRGAPWSITWKKNATELSATL